MPRQTPQPVQPAPSLMRRFVLAWIANQPDANGDAWTYPQMAEHLGVSRQNVWRLFSGESHYNRKGGFDDFYLPRMAQFIGKTPLEVYNGALRMWARDPQGLTLAADEGD